MEKQVRLANLPGGTLPRKPSNLAKMRRVRTMEKFKMDEGNISNTATVTEELSGTGVNLVPKHTALGNVKSMGIKANFSVNDLCKAAVAAQVTQKDVVVVFAEMLEKIAIKNDDFVTNSNNSKSLHPALMVFQGQKVPKVSLKWYLWRIVYYLNKYPRVEATFFAGDEGTISADFSSGKGIDSNQDSTVLSRGLRSLLLSLVYIDRVTTLHPTFLLSSYSLHRIVLTAVLVATKFTDDFPLGVDVFAKIGGIHTKDMGKMESWFCTLINFDFHVSESEFEAKCMMNLRLAFDIASQRVGRALPSPRKPKVHFGETGVGRSSLGKAQTSFFVDQQTVDSPDDGTKIPLGDSPSADEDSLDEGPLEM